MEPIIGIDLGTTNSEVAFSCVGLGTTGTMSVRNSG